MDIPYLYLVIIPKSIINDTPIYEGILKIIMGYASWFIVVLGVSELFYTVIFHFCRNIRIVPVTMVLSIVIGYIIKTFYHENMPYLIDSAFIVNVFVGFGILYRHYEDAVNKCLKIRLSNFFLFITLYTFAYFFDQSYLQTPIYVYSTNYHYNNVLLYILYAMLGIIAMLQLVRLIKLPSLLPYIGRNSLAFYYLNGGCIRCLTFLLGALGLHSSTSMHFYPITVMMAVAATFILIFVSMAIHRWLPLILGDKEAFNRVSKKMRINISW